MNEELNENVEVKEEKGTQRILVYKPHITFKDSAMDLGESANYLAKNYNQQKSVIHEACKNLHRQSILRYINGRP